MSPNHSPADEIPEARWANKFNSGFRLCVIELAFYQCSDYQCSEKPTAERVLTRIVTSPEDAKDFLLNLQGTLEKYEERFGPIEETR